jgi:hypothetical protein
MVLRLEQRLDGLLEAESTSEIGLFHVGRMVTPRAQGVQPADRRKMGRYTAFWPIEGRATGP